MNIVDCTGADRDRGKVAYERVHDTIYFCQKGVFDAFAAIRTISLYEQIDPREFTFTEVKNARTCNKLRLIPESKKAVVVGHHEDVHPQARDNLVQWLFGVFMDAFRAARTAAQEKEAHLATSTIQP